MNKYTKMSLMRSMQRREDDRRDYDRPDIRGGYGEPESRFRDRDGREHYNNGRYAPMNRGGYGGDPMDRGGDSYPRSAYMEPYSHYPMTPYIPPVYQREDWQIREGYRPMNRIGFSVDGEMERLPHEMGYNYRAEAMPSHQGSGYDMGQIQRMMPVFNRRMAEEWTSKMENRDGTKGPHFSQDKSKEIMKQYNVDYDPLEFWAALNATYSDMCEFFKKHNINTMDAYVDHTLDFWFRDQDAVGDKLAAYYTYVVRH